MESCKEFEGRDIESAVQAACESLNIARKDIKYEILSRGSTGVFGFVGVRKARIKALLPVPLDGDTEPNAEEAISPEPHERAANEGAKTLVDETFQNMAPQPVPASDLVEFAEEAIKRISSHIVEDAHIETVTDKGRILFNIKSTNSGLIIGKRGQTIEAIQYLMDKIINKRSEARVMILVDVEGYVHNRTSNLTRLARRMAEKVKKTGKPASINQMNAYDRRIVHLTLKDDCEVKTQSIGEGYYRKLMIFPKKGNGRRPRQDA